MKCRSKNMTRGSWLVTRLPTDVVAGGYSSMTSDERRAMMHGFTLVEAMAAVTLLAFIGASVWIVMEQCSLSATDSTQRMRAYETARDNMEKLLGASSVEESTEYGISEQFPDIHWQTTVETFYQPVNAKIWVRAVANADYTDSAGETQTVSIATWLTELTSEQIQQLTDRKSLLEKLLDKHLIDTDELAAEYANVTVDTILAWVKNGMPTFDKAYIKPWLDLYMLTEGQPTDLDIQRWLVKYPELETTTSKKYRPDEQTESATDTEMKTETQDPAESGTETSADADSSKLPENLSPAVKKEFEQLNKNK